MQTCTHCVMDESADDITFDSLGVCNFCSDFVKSGFSEKQAKNLSAQMDELLETVRKDGVGKSYDCIVGLSGGVDSSFALHLAVKHGLRPLAVHLDNGWNSELAVFNINSLISKLDVDLYTHVIDWQENRDLQLSMFKSHVIDIELLMDNAMLALNHKMAAKYKIKYILSGSNQATEGIRMPSGWNHFKFDAKNIRSIHKEFGTHPIKTHPLMGTVDYLRYKYINKIQWVSFLDYVNYNKSESLKLLVDLYGYKPYPYKHYESVFTRFYQGYILPHKFKIDKRRVHLSTLIVNGHISREEALNDLLHPPYDPMDQTRDEAFVLKKLGLTKEQFEEYISLPGKQHLDYPSELQRWNTWLRMWSKFKKRKHETG